MRIISLLPSATEVVFALGADEHLVGVTHECDFPAAARSKRQVSRSTIPPGATSAEIDALVVASAAGGPPTTDLDENAIRELAPDVLLTQDLCAVCAIPAGRVDEALSRLGCAADVVSLDPSTLDDVLDDIGRIGAALGREADAKDLMADLRRRLRAVQDAVEAAPTQPRVLALEWADPPFNAGHWVPEMIRLAGGVPVLARHAMPSIEIDWRDVSAAAPDVLVFMPCGYSMQTAVTEATEVVLARPEVEAVPVVVAAHGDAFFSRPGPRLVDGVEILAGLLHPDRWEPPSPDAARLLRPGREATAPSC